MNDYTIRNEDGVDGHARKIIEINREQTEEGQINAFREMSLSSDVRVASLGRCGLAVADAQRAWMIAEHDRGVAAGVAVAAWVAVAAALTKAMIDSTTDSPMSKVITTAKVIKAFQTAVTETVADRMKRDLEESARGGR